MLETLQDTISGPMFPDHRLSGVFRMSMCSPHTNVGLQFGYRNVDSTSQGNALVFQVERMFITQYSVNIHDMHALVGFFV